MKRTNHSISMQIKLRSESGSVLPLILILMAFMSVLAFGVGGLSQNRHDDIKRINTKLSGKYIAKHFENYLQRRKVWDNMLSHPQNANMACLGSPTGCGTSAQMIRFITHAAGAVIYDQENQEQGFTPSAQPCTGAGSATCPFRLKLTIAPDCPPAPASCAGAPSKVKGEVEFVAATTGPALNTTNYSFEIEY